MGGRLTRLLPRDRSLRRLTVLATSTAFAQGLMVAAMPLLTRLYLPEEFGAYTAFTMTAAVIGIVVGLRYEAAIPLCRDDAEAAAVVCLVVSATVGFALVTAAAVAVGGAASAPLPGLGGHRWLFAWLPLALLLEGLFLAANGWALYRGAVRALALSKLAQWGTIAVSQLVLGFAAGGAGSLVGGLLLGQAMAIVPIVLSLDGAQRRLILVPDLAQVRGMARRYARFPLLGSWAALLNSAAVLLPAPLLAAIFGPLVAGWYGLAQRAMGLPIRFLAVAASQVFTTEITQVEAGDRATLKKLFDSTVRRLALLGLAYLGAVGVFGPDMFAFIFGDNWRPSGDIARLLSIMYLSMFINYPIQYTLQFFERQDLNLLVNACGFITVLACFAAAAVGWLDYRATVLATSVGLALSYAASFMLARRLVARGSVAKRADR